MKVISEFYRCAHCEKEAELKPDVESHQAACPHCCLVGVLDKVGENIEFNGNLTLVPFCQSCRGELGKVRAYINTKGEICVEVPRCDCWDEKIHESGLLEGANG